MQPGRVPRQEVDDAIDRIIGDAFEDMAQERAGDLTAVRVVLGRRTRAPDPPGCCAAGETARCSRLALLARSAGLSWWRSRFGDLALEPDGLLVHILHLKTDQAGQGRRSPSRAARHCDRSSRCRPGHFGEEHGKKLFRSVERHGRIGGALTVWSFALIVKHYAETAGLDARKFVWRSRRAAF